MSTKGTGAFNWALHKPRYYKLYDRLSNLPVELVHQVFSDLPLGRILEILCAVDSENLTRLDECLLDHPKFFKVLFPNIKETPPIAHRIIALRIWENKNNSLHYSVPQKNPDREKDNEQASFWHIRDVDSPLFASAQSARVEHLLQLKQHFRVYLEMVAFTPHAIGLRMENLHFRDADWCLKMGMTGELIMRQLKSRIINDGYGKSSYEYFLPVLRQFAQPDDTDSEADKLPSEKETWDWDNIPAQWILVRKAENRLKLFKAGQLRRLVDLIQRYPGKLRLGKFYSTQRNVEGRDKHATRSLLSSAQKLEQPGTSEMVGSTIAGYVFKYKSFPLLPHDVFLRGFLKTLEKFPVKEAEKKDPKPKVDVYPEEIKAKIVYVLADFKYYHTRSDFIRGSKYLVGAENPTSGKSDSQLSTGTSTRTEQVKQYNHTRPEFMQNAQYLLSEETKKDRHVPRTLYTPYSCRTDQLHRARGRFQPIFAGYGKVDAEVSRYVEDWKKSDVYIGCIMPLVESEFVWLETFMEVCEFMEGMGGVQWTEGVTVAEWWKKHILS